MNEKNIALAVTTCASLLALASFGLSPVIAIAFAVIAGFSIREYLLLVRIELIELATQSSSKGPSSRLPTRVNDLSQTSEELSPDDWRRFAQYIIATRVDSNDTYFNGDLEEPSEDVIIENDSVSDVDVNRDIDNFAQIHLFEELEKEGYSDLQFIESKIDELNLQGNSLVLADFKSFEKDGDSIFESLSKHGDILRITCRNIYQGIDLIPYCGIVGWEQVDFLAQELCQLRANYDSIHLITTRSSQKDPWYDIFEVINSSRWVQGIDVDVEIDESEINGQSIGNI